MGYHPLVYLRADGNEDIATGHLMRCLSIARALRRRKAAAAFIVSDSLSVSLLTGMFTLQERTEHAFPILQLQTDYKNPEQELPVMQSILSAHNAAAVLVDSYFATPHYLSALRELTQTAYIDDLQAFDPPADLVINYDLTVDNSFYQKADRLLTGISYTPLREQFSACPYHVWDTVKDLFISTGGTVKDLFISTGGTDPFNIAGGLLKRLSASPLWKDVTFHVLTGPMHVHRAELLSMAEADARIVPCEGISDMASLMSSCDLAFSAGGTTLYELCAVGAELLSMAEADARIVPCEGISDMASLMSSCDLAFSAGGTTLYELCAVGVPSVSYTMADNQIPGVLAFSQAGLIPYVGDIRNHPDFFGNAIAALEGLMTVPAARHEQSSRMKMAIDGAGADRIAEALTKTAN